MLTAEGPTRVGLGGDLLATVAGEADAAPVTGDWVLLRDWPDERSTVETILPRRTSLTRATPSRDSRSQLLATNVTVAAIVVGLVPDPVVAKLDRLLAVAWGSGARPLLVLTKADLVSDGDEIAREIETDVPGVEVVVCSTVSGKGLNRLHALVSGSVPGAGSGTPTTALLGTSGVGKSSLVNALLGAPVLTTRQIRADGRGRHTSVRRELVLLPGGGVVIDTPGLRGVGLAASGEAGAQGLARVFDDVERLASACRFADCTHVHEPGCAVVAAVDAGVLPPRRLAGWLRLQRELAWVERRNDVRLRAQAGRRARLRRSGRRPPWF